MKNQSRLQVKKGIELTPMIDIILLLVIYFLINTTLIKNPSIKIQLPKSTEAKVNNKKDLVVHITREEKIYINEKETTLDNLTSEIKKQQTKQNDSTIILKADKKVQYQTIVNIMDALHKGGIVKFNLATSQN